MSKERPILFNGAMVRVLLDGSKTQTRRVVKPAKCKTMGVPMACCEIAGEINRGDYSNCPYGQPGYRLWVRETFYCDDAFYPNGVDVNCHWREIGGERVPIPIEEQRVGMLESMYYRADGEPEWEAADGNTPWRPSIHMPRWASRINLVITAVRVERLQDISEADAVAEGIVPHVRGGWHWLKHDPSNPDDWNQFGYKTAALAYQALWESINGPGSWEANPWVWVVEFKRVESAA